MSKTPPKILDPLSFVVGQTVTVKDLPGTYAITELLPRKSQARIARGSLSMLVSINALRFVSAKPEGVKRRAAQNRSKEENKKVTLDLHGLLVRDAMDKLETTIDRAILNGCSQLEVVHGHGTGKVRAAVHAYLAKCRVVVHFKLSEGNAGITVAYFD